jgi:hypothetical protein
VNRAARALTIVLTIAAAGAVLAFRPVYEPDLGWHLAQGREALAGRLVRSNVFSFTSPDYPQPYTSWLSEAIAYGAWTTGGETGVRILFALTLAAAFGFIYLACRVRSGALASLSVLVLGFLVIEPRAIPRPHLVSFAAIAICSWLIERARAARSIRPLYAAVPLVAIWSNAHGESMFGPMMIGLFAAAEFIRPSALSRRDALTGIVAAIVCGLALLANPYGWGLIRYLYENAVLPQLLTISELRPAYLPVYKAFFVYVAFAAIVLLSAPKQLTVWEALAMVVFGALGWRYLRLTPLVFLVTAPMVAARLTSLSARGVDARAILITVLVGAWFASRLPPLAYVNSLTTGQLFPSAMFSPHAVEFIRGQSLSGPVFNSNNLGGWIEWTMYPDVRVFQDSRLQAYPRAQFEAILEASRTTDAWETLVRDVDWAILSTPRENALSGVGQFRYTDWAVIFWDDATEIVARRRGRFADLAARLEYQVLTSDADIFTLAPILSSPDGDRLRAEAIRQREENPEGFTAAAVMCLSGDRAACDDVDRIGARFPSLTRDVAFVRVFRSSKIP